MNHLRLSAACNNPGSVIRFEDCKVCAATPNYLFREEGAKLADFLSANAPSGTVDTLVRVLLHKQVLEYQERGMYEKAEALMAVHAIYLERTADKGS